VVAYPEVSLHGASGEWRRLLEDPDRPALGTWSDVPGYQRVRRLSAGGDPRPGGDEAGPADPPAAGARLEEWMEPGKPDEGRRLRETVADLRPPNSVYRAAAAALDGVLRAARSRA
jgi:hypothetical protein